MTWCTINKDEEDIHQSHTLNLLKSAPYKLVPHAPNKSHHGVLFRNTVTICSVIKNASRDVLNIVSGASNLCLEAITWKMRSNECINFILVKTTHWSFQTHEVQGILLSDIAPVIQKFGSWMNLRSIRKDFCSSCPLSPEVGQNSRLLGS